APRRVDQCAAGANKWILYDEYAKDSKLMAYDVKTNQFEPLAHGDMDSVVLSAERACFVRNLSVFCVQADRTEERIATDVSGAGLQMDPTGARMLIQAF